MGNDTAQKNCRAKGKSLIAFPEDYCVIDIETTGLDPKYDSIIEISALKINKGNIIDKFSSLVRPDEYYVFDEEFEDEEDEFEDEDFLNDLVEYEGEKIYFIDGFIKSLTGITNKMLADAPSINKVLEELKSFLGNYILVGHNVNFDVNFLYDNYEKIGHLFNNDFVDTMRLSKYILPDLRHHKLKTIAEYYKVNYSGAHRALVDCEITNECLRKLKEDAVNNWGSADDFIQSIHNKRKHKSYDMREIKAETDDFDIAHPLYGKECVFTGTLSKMQRKEAAQLVVNVGGICGNSITKKTNFLILGITDYKKTKGSKSNKQRKAEELKLKGNDIEIISENVFYDLISENQ